MGIKTTIKIPKASTPIYVRTVKHLVLLETVEFTLFMVHLVGSLLVLEVVLRFLGQSHEDAFLFRRLAGVGLFFILLFFGGPTFVAMILKHAASKRMVIYGVTVILAKRASLDTLLLIGWRLGSCIALGLVGMPVLGVAALYTCLVITSIRNLLDLRTFILLVVALERTVRNRGRSTCQKIPRFGNLALSQCIAAFCTIMAIIVAFWVAHPCLHAVSLVIAREDHQ